MPPNTTRIKPSSLSCKPSSEPPLLLTDPALPTPPPSSSSSGASSPTPSASSPRSDLQSLSASSSRSESSYFASEKQRAIHEKVKKSQRKLIGGNGGNGTLSFLYKHQLDLPAGFIATVLVSHFGLRIPLAETFLILQNRDPSSGLYSKAWTDLNFIFFWIVVFTFARAFVMNVVLKPIAIRCGIKREHQQNRFQEEGWVCLYYSFSWTLGMYVMRNSPLWNNWFFWFKPRVIFEDYPLTQLPHVMMWYYYVQLAFWLQQIFVLHIEVPRKDFWALMTHHTVTLMLISLSALANFWRAGVAVFVVMDLSDIILAFSKSIKYLGVSSKICDVFFGTFMVSWLYTRHYQYAYILHGFMFTAYEIIPYDLDIKQGKWFCWWAALVPIIGLGMLQILMIYWFALILRILFKILNGQNAEDDRSEDEQDSADEIEKN